MTSKIRSLMIVLILCIMCVSFTGCAAIIDALLDVDHCCSSYRDHGYHSTGCDDYVDNNCPPPPCSHGHRHGCRHCH